MYAKHRLYKYPIAYFKVKERLNKKRGYSVNGRLSPKESIINAYAVKSAEAVTALEASLLNLALHTAPLWPMNVPIQSPVGPSRSIGLQSK